MIPRGDWLYGVWYPGEMEKFGEFVTKKENILTLVSGQVGSNYEKTAGRKSYWVVPRSSFWEIFVQVYWKKKNINWQQCTKSPLSPHPRPELIKCSPCLAPRKKFSFSAETQNFAEQV